jgi:hypothetical protein
MTLLLALAMSLLLSTTTDILISNSYRASEEAFFAADAGIAVGRRSMQFALAEQIGLYRDGSVKPYLPDSQVLPDSTSEPNSPFFSAIEARAVEIANDGGRSTLENGSRYQIQVLFLEGGPVTTPARDPRTGVEAYAFRYAIRSTGRSERGARAEVVERGSLLTQVTVVTETTRSRKPFSSYGTFFDNGVPQGNLVMVSGTFTGPVHTNSHLRFSSNNNVVFRDEVTQVDGTIEYDRGEVPIPDGSIKGVTVSPGAYTQSDYVPPPQNNYVQELAVVDATGMVTNPETTPVDGNGRVTADALRNNLSDAHGNQPAMNGGDIAPGVYVASNDGSTITGGGIYVNGDAEITLSTAGDTQVIDIAQGGHTSTIRIDNANQTTTLSSGGTSRTFSGVPMDASINPDRPTPGISLFVDGSVTSLSGPPSNGGASGPAIASQTAMTITAQRNITITGDIKYAEPVVNADGSLAGNVTENGSILGIFTNDGNVVLSPDPAYTDGGGDSLEIDAAIAAFNSDKSNDNGKLEGTIQYDPASSPSRASRLVFVGARIQSNIGYIKYRNRAMYFDPRLRQGNFAPPFFPGIEIKSGPPKTLISFPGEQAVAVLADSWHRDTRRHRDKD